MISRTRSLLHDQSGQSIALYAITMLLLALITIFSISVGTRVRQKIKVQASADAAALGTAESQARAMNEMAWANRAIVSEYVSGLSVVGHESYLNYWEGMLQAESTKMEGPEVFYGAQCALCLPPDFPVCACEACYSLDKAHDIADDWSDIHDRVHRIWHTDGEALHIALHLLDVAYVVGAAENYNNGVNAYQAYDKLAKGQTLADAAAQAIDKNMVAAAQNRDGATPSASGASKASGENFENAVQDNNLGNKIADDDWDSYHEILGGERTDWIAVHSNFVSGIPWIQGMAKQVEEASDCEGTAINPSGTPSNSGGNMMSKYSAVGDVVSVNTGNEHKYNKGAAFGEGGKYAMTAVNKGGTSVIMFCEACIWGPAPGSASESYSDNARMEGPKGCSNDSYVMAYDGYSDGDTDSSAAHKWPAANGVTQLPHACSDDGITAGGFFRFEQKGDANVDSNSPNDLWNQPYAFSSLEVDISQRATSGASGTQWPWDFNFGAIGGSILTLNAGQSATGAANTADSQHNLNGKGFDNTVWPMIGGFGTALTYYHNPKYWEEVPNLWNPFWRAKLEDPSNTKKKMARNITDDLSGDDLTVANAMWNDSTGVPSP